MTPDQICGLAAFLAGLGAGVLVQWVCIASDRSSQLRKRLREPPFTTIGAGRRE